MVKKLVFALTALLGFASCRQDMQDQPKYLAYRGSETFPDSLSSRPLVEGTVARGFLRDDQEYYTGKSASAQPVSAGTKDSSKGGASASTDVTTFPFPITRQILDLGQERYGVYCTPCHGVLGDGKGMIALRGFKAPPSYHQDRLRTVAVGHFYDVMTHGFGVMPDYAMQIPPHERWAIAAYIRALQISQNASIADVPVADRATIK